MALLLTEADVTQGVAMEDVLVAVRLVARARAEGVGQEIPI